MIMKDQISLINLVDDYSNTIDRYNGLRRFVSKKKKAEEMNNQLDIVSKFFNFNYNIYNYT